MKKHVEYIVNESVRRQDTTWKYEWDADNPVAKGTIFLNPVIYNKDHSKNWTLAPDEDSGANLNTLDDEGKNKLNAKWFGEFTGDSRYLRVYNSFLTVRADVGDVIIDEVPPKFISDEDTEYITLSPTYNTTTNDDDETIYPIIADTQRHFEFQFQDRSGLDLKQIGIFIGEGEDAIPLYEYYRPKEDEEGYEEIIFSTYDYLKRKGETDIPEKYKSDRWIKNIRIKYDGGNYYSVSFDLIASEMAMSCKNPDDKLCKFFASPNELLKLGYIEDDEIPSDAIFLNEIPEGVSTIGDWIEKLKESKATGRISLRVYDLAGNYSEYVSQKEFWTIDIDDIDKLEPVQITFFDQEPSNYFIRPGMEGSVWVSVQDMVSSLWRFPVEANLTGISIGQIDPATYGPAMWDDTDLKGIYNFKTGERTFNVINFTEYGFVEVEGWVQTGNKKIDALIKERTYNTGRCGPWLYEDEGRKYDLMGYVPKCLRNVDFNDFVEWFQLYINTMYLSLDKNRNISALEKIARIGNFNDIDKIEDSLLMFYEKEFGNEIPFDKDALKEINNTWSKIGWEVRDEQEVYDIIKYVMGNLPHYNKYKGSNIGVVGAIKMFGYSCKVINLWCKMETKIDPNPTFIEEDRLQTFARMFQTSRFNIESNAICTFEAFNENLDYFIEIIKAIKPITKILDTIKYTVYTEQSLGFVTNTISKQEDAEIVRYNLTWDISPDLAERNRKTATIINSNCKNISLPYKIGGKSYYTILGKLFDCNCSVLYIKCTNETQNKNTIYSFSMHDFPIQLNPGYFCLTTISTSYTKINGIYNYMQECTNGDVVKIQMTILDIPGTDFIQSINSFE